MFSIKDRGMQSSMKRRNPNLCSTDVVKREKGTAHKEHLFSTSETTTKKEKEVAASVTRALWLDMSSRGEREQWFDHEVLGEYSFICFLNILLPPL